MKGVSNADCVHVRHTLHACGTCKYKNVYWLTFDHLRTWMASLYRW